MADFSRPDLCIIGAGALGIALALHARQLGATVVLVDRGRDEPGDGPEHAVKLAAIQASAARAHALRSAAPFGVGGGEAKVSMRAVQERAAAIAAGLAPLTSPERLKALGVDIATGDTHFVDPGTILVGQTQFKPRAIVIAAGALPTLPAIPGLADGDYFTPETILENTRKLTHLLVIGGSAAGLALAQVQARLGAEVTYVPQGRALEGFDAECASILLAAMAAEGVRVIDGGTVKDVRRRAQGIGAVVQLATGDEQQLDLSHVLVASGGSADVESLGIEQARLKNADGHFATGPLGQTSNRRIRVAGPAAGLFQWQQAFTHGRAVIDDLVGARRSTQASVLPRLVQTEPALIEFGRLPDAAGKAKARSGLYRQSLGESEAARAAGAAQGLVKVATDAKGQIVGAAIVAPDAAELAAVLALLMQKGLPLHDLAGLALPHPSGMAVLSGLGDLQMAERAAARPRSGWRRWRP